MNNSSTTRKSILIVMAVLLLAGVAAFGPSTGVSKGAPVAGAGIQRSTFAPRMRWCSAPL